MTDPATARALREEDLRRFVREPYLPQFDRDFAAEFGRYPSESPLAGTAPVNTERRAKIAALAAEGSGATEGERAAATAALHRLEHPSTQAHAATERGSYYARDTLGGSTDEQ